MFLGSVERGETDIMLLPKRPAWFGKQNCDSIHLHIITSWFLDYVRCFLCQWHNISFSWKLVCICFTHSSEKSKSAIFQNVFFGVCLVDDGKNRNIGHRNYHVQSSERGSFNLNLRIFSYLWRFAKVIITVKLK